MIKRNVRAFCDASLERSVFARIFSRHPLEVVDECLLPVRDLRIVLNVFVVDEALDRARERAEARRAAAQRPVSTNRGARSSISAPVGGSHRSLASSKKAGGTTIEKVSPCASFRAITRARRSARGASTT